MERIIAGNVNSAGLSNASAASEKIAQETKPASKPDSYEKAEPKGNLWDSFWCSAARMDYNWHTGECTASKHHAWNFRR